MITPLLSFACAICSKTFLFIAEPFVSIVSTSNTCFNLAVSSLPSTTTISLIFKEAPPFSHLIALYILSSIHVLFTHKKKGEVKFPENILLLFIGDSVDGISGSLHGINISAHGISPSLHGINEYIPLLYTFIPSRAID